MNLDLFYLLVILAIVLLCIWLYQQNYPLKSTEGFQQHDRFLLKTDADCYDEFYSEIYDTVTPPEHRIIDEIIQTLQPDSKLSIMLDVGSGTGHTLSALKKKGYTAYGIDRSPAMIDVSKKTYPSIEIKCENVENPMAFDRALFTHVFCMNSTIYEMENKRAFFKNCFYWLQNNGYLILHLTLNNKRATKTDYGSFVYTAESVASKNTIVFKESFIDKQTQNIRQNERTLYTESDEDILSIAKMAGFIPKGSLLSDKEHVILLERVS